MTLASDSTTDKSSDEATKKSLEVCFILDITGSMGNEIDAVKQMISEFCKVEREAVNIRVITFTENRKKCYVSESPLGLKGNALVEYVDKINLSSPPDHPDVYASGDDCPENVVAALASLIKSYNSNDNILAFVITDDNPHHKAYGHSEEADVEKEWLDSNGFDTHDIFKILNEVIESLNITIIPVLYSYSVDNKWYQQAAVLSDGLILCPESRESKVLATGLGSILNMVQNLSISRQIDENGVAQTAEMCRGFSILELDLDNFQAIGEDPDTLAGCTFKGKKKNGLDDIKASLLGLMETTFNRFSGKKSGKRCRSVDPQVISGSIRFLVWSILDIIDSPLFNKEKLEQTTSSLLESIDKSKSESIEYEKKLVHRWIEKVDAYKTLVRDNLSKLDSSIQPVSCLITLNNALEYLNTLSEVPLTEKDVSEWMDIVLQLTMCRLINIKFPVDFYGKPDFNDAWSATVKSIELSSVMTASSAAKIRDPDTGIYIDPISRRENTAALILAHPNDKVLTTIYTCLTGLTSLIGLIQSYLVSGGLKVFPSISSGLQASCLVKLIRSIKINENVKQSEWEVLRCIIWTIRNSIDTPASNVVSSLKNDKSLNPTDNLSKLITGIIVYLNRNKVSSEESIQIFKSLFEEMSTGMIASIMKKRKKDLEKEKEKEKDNDGDEVNAEIKDDGLISDNDFIKCLVKSVNDKEYDCCKELHLSEKICKKIEPLPKDGFEALRNLLNSCQAFKFLVNVFKNLCDLMECDLEILSCDEAYSKLKTNENRYSKLLSVDEMAEIFSESYLLRKRTGRYKQNETDPNKWCKLDSDVIKSGLEDLCLDEICEFYKPTFSKWNSDRKEFAQMNLYKEALNFNIKTYEEANEKLKNASIEVVGQKYTLERSDAIKLLKKIKTDNQKLKTLGLALCIGDWTSEPPSQLRKQLKNISFIFQSLPDEFARIEVELGKRQVCNRELPNRSGHTKFNTFPGALGWTQKYHDERIKNVSSKPKALESLLRMKSDAEYLQKINTDVEKLGNNRKTLITRLLRIEYEPQQVTALRNAIEFLMKTNKVDNSSNDKEVSIIIEKLDNLKRLRYFSSFLNGLASRFK